MYFLGRLQTGAINAAATSINSVFAAPLTSAGEVSTDGGAKVCTMQIHALGSELLWQFARVLLANRREVI